MDKGVTNRFGSIKSESISEGDFDSFAAAYLDLVYNFSARPYLTFWRRSPRALSLMKSISISKQRYYDCVHLLFQIHCSSIQLVVLLRKTSSTYFR